LLDPLVCPFSGAGILCPSGLPARAASYGGSVSPPERLGPGHGRPDVVAGSLDETHGAVLLAASGRGPGKCHRVLEIAATCSWRRSLVCWLPFLVPPLYLVMVFWEQPPDQLTGLDTPSRLGRLLYDDYDPAARVLRGLNATLGRAPGLLD